MCCGATALRFDGTNTTASARQGCCLRMHSIEDDIDLTDSQVERLGNYSKTRATLKLYHHLITRREPRGMASDLQATEKKWDEEKSGIELLQRSNIIHSDDSLELDMDEDDMYEEEDSIDSPRFSLSRPSSHRKWKVSSALTFTIIVMQPLSGVLPLTEIASRSMSWGDSSGLAVDSIYINRLTKDKSRSTERDPPKKKKSPRKVSNLYEWSQVSVMLILVHLALAVKMGSQYTWARDHW